MGCGGSKLGGSAGNFADHRRRRLFRSHTLDSLSRKISPAPEDVSGEDAPSFSSASTTFANGSKEDPPATLLQNPSDIGGCSEREEQEVEKMELRTLQYKDIPPSLCRKYKETRVENVRRQLEQLAEELARFEAWSLVEDEEEDYEEDEEDGDEPFQTPCTEGESASDEISGDQEDNEGQFEENFTNKLPVYDEYPFDLLQEAPIAAGDFSYYGNPAAPNLTTEKRGSEGDQIDPAPRPRSKLGGGEERKLRIHHQLRGGKIRKHRGRKTRSQGRSSSGAAH